MIFHQKFAMSQNFQLPTQCVVGAIGKNFRKIIDGPSTLKIEKAQNFLFIVISVRKYRHILEFIVIGAMILEMKTFSE